MSLLLAISGCGKTDNEPIGTETGVEDSTIIDDNYNEVTEEEESETEETTANDEPNNEYGISNAAYDDMFSEEIVSVLKYGFPDFDDLDEIANIKDNAFADEINKIYTTWEIHDCSDLEREIYYCFILNIGRGEIGEEDIDIDKMWQCGYDENGMLINQSEFKDNDIVISLKSGKYIGGFCYYQWDEWDYSAYCYPSEAEYVKFHGDFSSDKEEYTDYDAWDNEHVMKRINIDATSICEKVAPIGKYLQAYCETAGVDYKNEVHVKSEAEKAAKEREPAVGMTKEEVLNGKWGSPSKKNITETVNGTSEQWVYSYYGYVYFENGIVTAVQKEY